MIFSHIMSRADKFVRSLQGISPNCRKTLKHKEIELHPLEQNYRKTKQRLKQHTLKLKQLLQDLIRRCITQFLFTMWLFLIDGGWPTIIYDGGWLISIPLEDFSFTMCFFLIDGRRIILISDGGGPILIFDVLICYQFRMISFNRRYWNILLFVFNRWRDRGRERDREWLE